MLDLDENNFEKEVLRSNIPVIVDFWAEWCGPCKIFTPTLEEISRELNGKAKFVKLNVDENTKIAEEYGIMSIPTVLVFEKGEAKAQSIGAIAKDQFRDWLSENLG